MNEKKIRAYKAFNSDWKCRDFQYKVGKTYEIEGELKMCENGFHACTKMVNCFNFYDNNKYNKYAEVELSGIVYSDGKGKQCSSKIKIIKEIPYNEVIQLSNIGYNNTGIRNSGDSNSGDSNSGHRNSGDWNSGDWNSGDSNSGHRNSGDWNSGDFNSGYFNSNTPAKINVFNKECLKSDWDKAQKPNFIYFTLTEWVKYDKMTNDEKENNNNAEALDGYLKTLNYKEAWLKAYTNASKKDIELLKALPNFDADVFYEISGIDIRKNKGE